MPRAPTRSVVTFLGSLACSSTAGLMLTTILGKQVFDLTGRELDLGLLGLVEFAPAAFLVLVTGTLADRVDRRALAATALGCEGIMAAALAWYATTEPTAVAPVFVLVLGFGLARAFAMPASRALPADIVPPPRLPWLTVRYSGTWQVATIVGPVLGGALYVVDPALPYAVAAGLLGVAALAMLSVRLGPHVPAARLPEERAAVDAARVVADAGLEAGVEPSEGQPIGAVPVRGRWHEALEGLRFVRSQPALLGAISLDLFAVLFGGAVALLPAIAEERLGVGAVGLGWLRAAVGIGAATMTLGLAIRPVRRHVGVTLLAAVAVFGVGTIVLGVTTSFAVAFTALAVLSAADAISVFIRATLVPLIAPDDKRGRVLAVEMVLIGASNELGAFESGITGQLLGPAGAVVLGGVGTLVVAAAWWWWFPALRAVDRFPRLDAAG